MLISSNDVFVFPCVSRNTDDEQKNLDAKLMSEKNITNIIKSITDKESYIISWENSILKCVVRGYYFEIAYAKPDTQTDLYLHLHLGTRGDILQGDNEEVFDGVTINNDPTVVVEGVQKDADLMLYKGELRDIPEESYYKFEGKSMFGNIKNLDCGELN